MRNNKTMRRRPAKKKPLSGAIWLIAGLLIGLFIAGLVYLKQRGSLDNREYLTGVSTQLAETPKPKTTKASKPKVPTEDKDAQTPEKPRFDFYSILPNTEVAVSSKNKTVETPTPQTTPTPVVPQRPAQEAKAVTSADLESAPTMPTVPTTKNSPHAANPIEKKGPYLLQIASFKSFDDADRLKAQLALLGYPIEVRKVNADGGTWNRVYMGPIPSLQEALSKQQQLKEQRFDSILVKIK